MKYEQAGTYTIIYKAVDGCGNETDENRTVIVVASPQKKTVLFNDGTFIVNELSTNRDANIEKHGGVVNEYVPLDETNPYVFESGRGRPWIADSLKIKSVEFGSEVTPTSLAYWFVVANNLASIDWKNFNGSEVTTARSFANGAALTSLTLPKMPKLTSIRYMCNTCLSLETVDMSNVGATGITEMTDAFQACYKLKTVDMTGLAGTVEDSQRAFANTSGGDNMALTTIYATDKLDFSQSNATSMFRACVDLVGGNGTTYDANYTGGTRARIDKQGEPGYFTAKE